VTHLGHTTLNVEGRTPLCRKNKSSIEEELQKKGPERKRQPYCCMVEENNCETD